ncbi:LuxR C-terminal-related transcriptional regulator [Williamsia muralis]|uniref:helix-turn-helix transcriptional regulator n=1 Tax=Williamsia marianensis TaxID=85044 RepID=UPI003F1656DE
MKVLNGAVSNAQQRTTLVTGPAGSGKTTLLADWVSQRQTSAIPVAWLTIDDADNNVEAFCASLRQAVGLAVDSSVSEAGLRVLNAEDSEYQDLSVRLSDVLDASTDGLCLVVDDAHLLRESASLKLLARVMRWAPDNVHIIIAGRFEPSLMLYRARLSSSLAEIDGRALAFREEEAAELFEQQGAELPTAGLHTLMMWTEGWAAGLQLAALGSSGASFAFEAPVDFVGDGKHLTDYVVGEFLAVLTEPVRQLLVMTSIFETFSAELAVELSQNPRAQHILDQLAHNGFLLERSHRRLVVTYRLHPLVRRQLRAEVKLLDPQVRKRVETDSVAWHLEMGQPIEAFRCAIETGNGPLLLDVVERCGIEVLISAGDELLQMLDRAPVSTQKTNVMSLMAASAHIGNGDLAAASAMLTMTDTRACSEHTATEAILHETLRMQVALCGDPVKPADVEVELAHLVGLVDQTGSEITPDGQAYGLLHAAVAEMLFDRLDSAERKVIGALGRAQVSGSSAALMHSYGAQSVLLLMQGRLSTALLAAENCIEVAGRLDAVQSVTAGLAILVSDYVRHQRVEAIPVRPTQEGPDLAGSAFHVISEAALRTEALLMTSRPDSVSRGRLTPNHPPEHDCLPKSLHALFAAESQQLLLVGGNYSQAHQYATYVRALLPGSAEGAVLTAMHRHSVGRTGPAEAALAPAIDGLPSAHPVTTVWTHLMHAVLIESVDPNRTFYALSAALEAAEKEQISRPFWFLRSPVRSLLVRHRGRFGASEAYAVHLRSLIDEASAPSVCLSPRELDVLRELASSRPASVIAADLSISVNTTKTHLRGIYRKLGVSNKWDALTVAQNSGLI